jgi:hypothetical protein
MNDAWVPSVRRSLRISLYLAFFVEFSFLVAMVAVMGLFNGGQPTTTPPIAGAYFAVGFLVTLAVIMRTRRLIDAVDTANPRLVWRLDIRRWAWIAFVFSAILPGIYLFAAMARLPREA